MFANHKTSLLTVLIAVTLFAAAMWTLSPRSAAPVRAGGGEGGEASTMNQMFTLLLTKNSYTVTLQLAAPVVPQGETQLVVTTDGSNDTFKFERNGADHVCVKLSDPAAPTFCIPFSNIASFSYEGPLQ
jgi:hypothetical protein